MKSLRLVAFTGVVMLMVMLTALNAVAANTITFDNQSGKPALVKLVGPTAATVTVPKGTKQTTNAAAGHYTIKVRYGTPGAYAYSKGDEFDVKETATSESAITITLHAVVNGNYGTRPISETEFGRDPGEQTTREEPLSTSREASSEVDLITYLMQQGGFGDTLILVSGTAVNPEEIVKLKKSVGTADLKKRFGEPLSLEKDATEYAPIVQGPLMLGERWRYGSLGLFVVGGEVTQFAEYSPTVTRRPVAPALRPAFAGRLDDKEQKCLALLGDTFSWSFSQSAMDIAKAREIRESLKDKVRSASDLREASLMVARMDPKVTHLFIVPSKRDVDFEVIQAVLGKPVTESQDKLLQEPFSSGLSVQWEKYGWLEFAVSGSKVVAVRGDCAVLRANRLLFQCGKMKTSEEGAFSSSIAFWPSDSVLVLLFRNYDAPANKYDVPPPEGKVALTIMVRKEKASGFERVTPGNYSPGVLKAGIIYPPGSLVLFGKTDEKLGLGVFWKINQSGKAEMHLSNQIDSMTFDDIRGLLEKIGSVTLTDVGTTSGSRVAGDLQLGEKGRSNTTTGHFDITVVPTPEDFK